MVLAHYFREDGREKARAENEKVQAEKADLRWRIYELERKKMQAELDDLRKRVESLEAAHGKQCGE